MKQLLAFTFILFVCVSYCQPAKTDPYFVRSIDTVSKFGPACITRYILEDKKGNVWMATWKGIVKYDGKVFTNYTLKENLIPFHVFSVYQDRSGKLWFGTVRGGVYQYDGKSFTLFTTENGLANDLLGGMMEDRQGDMWFATDGGLSRLDTSALGRNAGKASAATVWGLPLTSKNGFTNYSTQNGLCGDRVWSLIQDRSRRIWIFTRSGLSQYDGKSFTEFKIKQGQPFTNVCSVKEDRSGKIWIGGQDGLYCYDPSKTGEASLTKLMSNFIGNIYVDKGGNIWLSAGEAQGMALYKYDQKTFIKMKVNNAPGDSQIFEISEDSKGNIWFGTMKGPCRYDGKTFTYF